MWFASRANFPLPNLIVAYRAQNLLQGGDKNMIDYRLLDDDDDDKKDGDEEESKDENDDDDK